MKVRDEFEDIHIKQKDDNDDDDDDNDDDDDDNNNNNNRLLKNICYQALQWSHLARFKGRDAFHFHER